MAYYPPLRAAVSLLAPLGLATPEQVAAIADSDAKAAKSYCTRLVKDNVITQAGGTGAAWTTWITTKPNTRLGGRSVRYLRKRAGLD